MGAFRGPPIELRKAIDKPVKFYSFNVSDPNRILAYRGSAFFNRGAVFPQMLRNSTGGLLINNGIGAKSPDLSPATAGFGPGYAGGGGHIMPIDDEIAHMPGSPFGQFSYNIPPTPHYMTPESLLKRWKNPHYNVTKLTEADPYHLEWPELDRWTQPGLTQSPTPFNTPHTQFDRMCNNFKNIKNNGKWEHIPP